MRLVDADKLRQKDMSGDLIDIFDVLEAPIVNAIPVEWIEKYKRVRGWEVTVTTQNAIDNMLNAWEKENAKAD